jgi:hypothetical protein
MNTLPEFLSKDAKAGLLRLGTYQIIGGIVGIGFTGWAVVSSPLMSWYRIVFFSMDIMLFTYSIFCGVLLVKSKKAGLNLSLINQFLQLIGWAIFGFAFSFSAGITLAFGIDLTNSLLFDLTWGLSRCDFTFNRDAEKIAVNFNLVALYLIYFTSKLKSRIKKEEMLLEIAKFGES